MEEFTILPVLDLKGGAVVRARAGDRQNYRPIETRLARDSDPASVLDGLLALAPFTAVYIADLDAIEGQGDHRPAIAALARRHPGMDFWVDAGIATASAARSLAADGLVPVIGSETLRDSDELARTLDALGRAACILSLDYRGEAFIGIAGLDTRPEFWPERIIAMTLGRVGSAAGPDRARLAGLRASAPGHRFYAAGGVRHAQDLAMLAEIGAAGALVATSLHDGTLDGAVLRRYVKKR
jgi:HisA/HisF family protein